MAGVSLIHLYRASFCHYVFIIIITTGIQMAYICIQYRLTCWWCT